MAPFDRVHTIVPISLPWYLCPDLARFEI